MDDHVMLRPVTDDDIPAVQRILGEPEAAGTFDWYGYHGADGWRRRIEQGTLLTADSGMLLVVAGFDRLGLVTWRSVPTSPISTCWAMGIALLSEARGKGYGTSAQMRLVEYLFSHTQANRVEAITDVNNFAEQRALERAGFTREGVLRGRVFRAGTWRDVVIYAVLRDEVHLPDTV